MFNKTSLVVSVLVVIAATGVATGQVATGTPAFGSFGGGPFDVINLGNLNVHADIPIVQKAGRGLPFTYDLSYDGSIFYPTTVSGTLKWQPVSNWGWRGVTEAAAGYVTYAQSAQTCADHSLGTFWRSWVYHDRMGIGHGFPFSFTTCSGGDLDGTGTATDGSGYAMYASAAGPSATVYPVGGGSITPPLQSITGASTVKDRNGNYFSSTYSSGTTTFTDTLGTTVLTVTGSGTPSSPMKYTYTGPSGSVFYTVTYKPNTVQTNFGCSGVAEYGPLSQNLVDTITLPDGSQYAFTYEATPGHSANVTGRLASVTIPSGGSITYAYTGGSNGITCGDGSTAGLTRTVSPGGQWTYARSAGTGNAWTTTVTDPQSNETDVKFQEDSSGSNNFYQVQRKIFQGLGGGTPLLTLLKCYNGNYASCATASVSSGITTVAAYRELPSGSNAVTVAHYNSFGQADDVKEYDYGVSLGSAPSSTYLKRETVTTYTALGNNINAPTQVTVKNGSGTVMAQTTITYGDTVTTTSGTPQHSSVTGARGNPITVSSMTTGTATLSKSFTYFDTGNPKVVTDVNGATTTLIYGTGDCGNSFPTEIDLPLSLTRHFTWDCNGAVTKTTVDENSNTTTYSFTDPYFWRLSKVSYPDGGSKTITYNTASSPWDIATSTKQTATTNITTDTVFDGLGRVTQTQLTSDPSGTDYVNTSYDEIGRVDSVSNPHRSTGSPTDGTTHYSYDALGRTTQITNPNSTSKTYTYTNRATQFTDESGITKVYQSDGLGRLVKVCDGVGAPTQANGSPAGDPAPCGLDITASGFLATYGYDALGNLINRLIAAQPSGGQGSQFSYDGLSRMLTENVVEIPPVSCGGGSYSKCYTYDTVTAGDLSTITFLNPAGTSVNAQYTWDALHRLTLLHYSDGANGYGYTYDQSTWQTWTLQNGKGRLTSQSHSNGGAAAYSYDAMGRPIWEGSCAGTNCYGTIRGINHGYDYAGAVTAITTTYTGAVSYAHNSIGQVTGVTSSWNDATHPSTLLSGAIYNALGELVSATYGDGIAKANTYDSLGRLVQASDGVAPTYIYNIYFTYNPNSTISEYQDNVTGRWDYTYDAFNRLATANLTQTGNNSPPHYSFSYDQYGNRWKQHVVSGTGTEVNYTFNAYNKNISSGFSYDSMGNVTKDGVCGSNPCWSYDYAGQLVSGNGASYLYDAVGRRQQKTDVGGTVRSFVYDGNSPYTEFTPGFARQTGGFYTYSNGTTYFNRTDHLGTPRLSTDYTGTVKRTEGALMGPFGDNFTETLSTLDFSGFAGGFWDSENNGEHFGAREYHNTHGSWLSPDPAGLAAVDPSDPQTWNRYAYVGNNPLSFVDPTGLEDEPTCKVSDMGCGGGSGDASSSGNFGPGGPFGDGSPWNEWGGDPGGRLNGVPVTSSMLQAAFRSGFAVYCQCQPGQVVGADNSIYDYYATTQRFLLTHSGLIWTGADYTLLSTGETAGNWWDQPANNPTSTTRQPWPSKDPSSCSAYGSGNLLNFVCKNAGTTRYANSARGCLQMYWDSGTGTYSMTPRGTGVPWKPMDQGQSVLSFVNSHAICLVGAVFY